MKIVFEILSSNSILLWYGILTKNFYCEEWVKENNTVEKESFYFKLGKRIGYWYAANSNTVHRQLLQTVVYKLPGGRWLSSFLWKKWFPKSPWPVVCCHISALSIENCVLIISFTILQHVSCCYTLYELCYYTERRLFYFPFSTGKIGTFHRCAGVCNGLLWQRNDAAHDNRIINVYGSLRSVSYRPKEHIKFKVVGTAMSEFTGVAHHIPPP